MIKEIKWETKTNIQLVQLIADDIGRLEMAEIMGLELSELDKRMHQLRKKYDCKMFSPLVALFYRNKLIH